MSRTLSLREVRHSFTVTGQNSYFVQNRWQSKILAVKIIPKGQQRKSTMIDNNALSTERQPSPEELAAAVKSASHYDPSEERRELARLTRMCGPVITITATQYFNQLFNPD